MRLFVSSIAAVSALALGGFATLALADQPSVQQQAPASQPTASTKADATHQKPALICRSQVTTGSLLPARECHTAEDWAEIHARGQTQLGNIAARPHGLGGS